MVNKYNVDQYVERINKAGKKSVLGFIEQGRECVDAEQNLTPDEKEELRTKLGLSPTKLSTYVAIGRCEFLEKYSSSLPPAKSILYELTQLTEEEVKSGIAEGVVHPHATRRTVEAWIAVKKGKASSANDNHFTLRIVHPEDFTDEEEEKLKNDIREFLVQRRCRLSGDESQHGLAAHKARDDFIKAAALAVQKLEKARRDQEERLKPKAQRTKAWPFTADQLKLGSKATAEDCQRMLELIGCSDDFAKIIAEADGALGTLDKPQPTPPQKTSVRKRAA